MPDLAPILFIYTSSVNFLTNLTVWEPKISHKWPIFINFGIFWLFWGDERTKITENTGKGQAQLGAPPSPFILHFNLWPWRYGATFYTQKRCFLQFFDILTGFNSISSFIMPHLVPILFIYTSSSNYLMNSTVLEPKISQK